MPGEDEHSYRPFVTIGGQPLWPVELPNIASKSAPQPWSAHAVPGLLIGGLIGLLILVSLGGLFWAWRRRRR